MGKAEGKLAITDLAAKTLPDQRLEIGLVIDAEAGLINGELLEPIRWKTAATEPSSDRNRPAL
jgi:hypothetical protein